MSRPVITMKHLFTLILPRVAIAGWMIPLLVILGGAWHPANARAEIRLPHVFGSHMVFQREKPVIIWGWANPGETVTVQLGSATQVTKANDQGEWKMALPPHESGWPLHPHGERFEHGYL